MSGEEQNGGSGLLGPGERGERDIVYCIVPANLASKLHGLLRDHFADDRSVEIIIERRCAERRRDSAAEANDDRRVGDRRAPQMLVEAGRLPKLPRKVRRYAAQLTFVHRQVPRTQHAEDLDASRLIARFRAGDISAFDTLYTRYFERVFGYLRVVLKDVHEAEDLTQEVFAKTFKALVDYEARGRPFRHWLFTSARNAAIQHLRKHGRIKVMDPMELAETRDQLGEAAPEPDIGGGALGWIVDRDLLFLVERLPVPQRQVLVLRYMLGLSTQETAQQLNLSPNNVAVLHYRALNFLRERLTALGRAPAGRANREPMRTWPKPAKVLRSRRFVLK